jgi:REP element-mobilizing transposase RayT
MRRLRFIPEQHVVEITDRTEEGRLLLRPGPHFNDLFLGVLGRAQRRYGMTIHYCAVLSNHYHLLVSPASPQQLAAFLCFFKGNLAKEICRIHGCKHHVWARRYQAIVVSDEEKVQVARLRYLLSHGVKEGLVAKVADWPGPNFLNALLSATPLSGTWFDRTAECKARRKGVEYGARDHAAEERVVLTPLPCWKHLPQEVRRKTIRGLVNDIENEAAAVHSATQRQPLGAGAIVRQDPRSQPMRSKKSPAPWFHTATRAAWRILRNAYDLFLGAYRRAAERLRAGDRNAQFPPRSFPPAMPATG